MHHFREGKNHGKLSWSTMESSCKGEETLGMWWKKTSKRTPSSATERGIYVRLKKMRQSSRIDVYTYWYVQLTAEHIFFSYIWVGDNLVNLPLRSSERLHIKEKKNNMFEDCGENSPLPPTKIHIILLGGMKLWIIHSSRWVLGKFVSKDFVVQLPNFIFWTGKASYLDDKALSFLNSSRWKQWNSPSEMAEDFFYLPIDFNTKRNRGYCRVAEDLLVYFWTNRGKLGDSLGLVWVVVLGLVDWLGEDFISRVSAKQFVEKSLETLRTLLFKSMIVCDRRWGDDGLIVSDHWAGNLLRICFLNSHHPKKRNTFLIIIFLAYRII